MTNGTLNLVALCIWREARGEGKSGMYAVGCVIRNRAIRHHMTQEQAVMVPWAFSSMTAHGDPQLGTMPGAGDLQYASCIDYANQLAVTEDAPDPTHGATLYYDDSISFPKTWDKRHVQATGKIGKLNFFREV